MPTFFPTSPSPPKSPDKTVTVLGYPAAFHWTVLTVLLGLLIFAAFRQLVPLLVTTASLLVLAVVPRFWSRYALRGLTGKTGLNHNHVFPGEEVELSLELANEGLSLPWVEAEIELPYRLVTGKSPLSRYTRKRLRWVTTLSHGQVITWKHTITAGARGEYYLAPLRLRSGDMFGLFPRELLLTRTESLLVYPRIIPLSKLELPLRALLGEKAIPRSIYEDVSRVAGARDYRYDDSFKRIHWKASAAHGKLQTRQYESSTSLSLLLILDVHSYPEENEVFEHAVSTIASLAYEAERQDFAVGLIASGSPEVRIAVSRGRDHLMRILEALARITAHSEVSIVQQMDRFRTLFPVGATIVVFTRTMTPALSNLTGHLKQAGYSLLCIGTERKEAVPESPAGESSL